MKRTLMILAAFAAFSTSALATNPPPATPVANIDLDAAAKAAAAAQAAAKAQADAAALSASKSKATGGDASAYSADGDVINQHSSKMFVFPAPVWTQVPAAQGCFVTESHAGSVVWNFASGSKSIQFSDPICVSVRMAESARMFCHFETADFIDRNTFKTMFPSAPPMPKASEGLRNLSLAECEEIKRPRLMMAPTLAPVVHTPPAAPEPVRPPKADRQ